MCGTHYVCLPPARLLGSSVTAPAGHVTVQALGNTWRAGQARDALLQRGLNRCMPPLPHLCDNDPVACILLCSVTSAPRNHLPPQPSLNPDIQTATLYPSATAKYPIPVSYCQVPGQTTAKCPPLRWLLAGLRMRPTPTRHLHQSLMSVATYHTLLG